MGQVNRRTLLKAVPLAAVPLAGCDGDGDTPENTPAGGTTTSIDPTTSPTTTPPVEGTDLSVTATDASRAGNGTVTIRWRPTTFESFTWEGTDGSFYEADPGSVYFVVQLALTASGGPHNYPSRSVTASVDGEPLGTVALSGDLSVDDPIEDGETVTGWRAWEIAESIDAVTLHHDASSATYDTEFQRDEDLPLEVSPYDE